MGFFDNLFSGWTGNPKAFGQGIGQLQSMYNQGLGQIGGLTNQGIDFLQNYGGQGIGALQKGFGEAQDSIRGFGSDALGTLRSYGGNALSELQSGYDKAFAPVEAALGTSFKESPGYRYQVDQGIDAINRARNARGMGNSGNTDVDALKYASGEANKDYYNWTDRLAGLGNARAAGAGNIASLINSQGRDISGLQTGIGQGIAGLQSGLGSALNQNYMGTGSNLAQLLGGASGNIAGLTSGLGKSIGDIYGTQGKAQMAGSGNIWGDIGNIGKFFAGLPGVKSLFGGFLG